MGKTITMSKEKDIDFGGYSFLRITSKSQIYTENLKW